MVWMEKQLESLTELVRELTRERAINEQTMLSKSAIYNSNHSGMSNEFHQIISGLILRKRRILPSIINCIDHCTIRLCHFLLKIYSNADNREKRAVAFLHWSVVEHEMRTKQQEKEIDPSFKY